MAVAAIQTYVLKGVSETFKITSSKRMMGKAKISFQTF
jgi:hypothetical protein